MQIKKTIESAKKLYPEFYQKSVSLTGTRKYYFLFFSTIITLNFILGFLLTEKNPLSLLIPFSFFELDLPISDKRIPVRIYLSDGSGDVFPSDRRVFLVEDDFRKKIITLATEISRPPYYEVEENLSKKDLKINLKKLPNLHYAIRAIWMVKDTLILDFRSSSIEDEIREMKVRVESKIYDIKEEKDVNEENLSDLEVIAARNKEEVLKKKFILLDSSFSALEKTLFDNFPEIKKIEYRLDGGLKSLPGMSYDLAISRSRGN